MRAPRKLNNVGLRATTPRLTVLNVFHKHAQRHLTAEDVFRWLADRRSTVGLATTYRVLNHLTEVGILHRTILDEGPAVYELQDAAPPHDHLVCKGCGRVDEFRDQLIHDRSRAVAEASGYAIARYQCTLYGYCPACLSAQHAGEQLR